MHACLKHKGTCAQRSGSGRQDSCNRETFPFGPDSPPARYWLGEWAEFLGEKLCLKASPSPSPLPIPSPSPSPSPLPLPKSSLPLLSLIVLLIFLFFFLRTSIILFLWLFFTAFNIFLLFCFSFTFVTSNSLPLGKVFFLSLFFFFEDCSYYSILFFVHFVSFCFLFSIFCLACFFIVLPSPSLSSTVHFKKDYRLTRPQPDVTKQTLPGRELLNYSWESLVSDIPAGDGKHDNLFYSVYSSPPPLPLTICVKPIQVTEKNPHSPYISD